MDAIAARQFRGHDSQRQQIILAQTHGRAGIERVVIWSTMISPRTPRTARRWPVSGRATPAVGPGRPLTRCIQSLPK